MKVKFANGGEKIILDFSKLPTPMVEYIGTAKELHDLIFKAAMESPGLLEKEGQK